MQAERTKPMRVDFGANEWDLECVLMAEAGMSTQAIMEITGLTAGQVSLRCRQAGVKRATYRNGQSKLSRMVRDLLLYRENAEKKAAIVERLPGQVETFRRAYARHKEELHWARVAEREPQSKLLRA